MTNAASSMCATLRTKRTEPANEPQCVLHFIPNEPLAENSTDTINVPNDAAPGVCAAATKQANYTDV
jgi:hypothetical protein